MAKTVIKEVVSLEQVHKGQLGSSVREVAELEQLRQLQKQMVREKIETIIEKKRVMRNDWDRF